MAARFTEVSRNSGFDSSINPHWVMVGRLLGPKIVHLHDGAGLTVVSTTPSIVTATTLPTEDASRLRNVILIAVSHGTGHIEVRNGAGTVVTSLDVGVKDLKPIKVAFHSVTDSRASRPHTTTRTAGLTPRRPGATPRTDLDGWIRVMNDIYIQQTSIVFTNHGHSSITVPGNLGRSVLRPLSGSAPAARFAEYNAITSRGDMTADFRVFFVWEVEPTNAAGDAADAITDTPGPNCLFEDQAGRDIGETLAHEAGHSLGVDDSGRRSLLMFKTTDARGRKIPRAHADLMNP